MVMDAAAQSQQPSPQSVGREFVRQYYTLLNKAPSHLHRFYNNNSSFIHGESTLVVGQRDIHNRIQQLNFNDCHAKISQVDAQATLGNGVVVQVTGELSNDGQPMRRFTQTFVLAAQSPKKYYVHNDIFRYQDHLYTDEENDGETRSENDDEHDLQTPAGNVPPQIQAAVTNAAEVISSTVVNDQQQQPPQPQQLPGQVVAGAAGVATAAAGVSAVSTVRNAQQQIQQVAPTAAAAGGAAPQQIYYSLPAATAGGRPVPVLSAGPQAGTVTLPAQFAAAAATQPVQSTQLNGAVSHDELLNAQQAHPQAAQPLIAQNASPLVQAAGVVSVAAAAGAPVALQPSVGIVPVATTGTASIPGFQQSPLVAPQLLQQQQQVSNAPAQAQTLLHATNAVQSTGNAAAAPDVDENVASSVNNSNANEIPVRTSTAAPAAKAPTPVDDFKTINEQQQQEKYEAAKQLQNEPKTYANLFKSTSSSPSVFVKAMLQQQQQQQLQQQQSLNNVYHSSTAVSSVSYTTTSTTLASSYSNNARLDNNLSSNNGNLSQRNNSIRTNNNTNKDYEQRRPSNAQFGDHQQLFLGNIPHHASEDDLRALFTRFGNVLELRILSKPNNKLPPGVRNPLNYGFITYEDPESVQKCLANCPLYFPEDSPDGQKLNVEEKKPRMRNDLPPRQTLGNNMSNNLGRGLGSGNSGPQSRNMNNNSNGGGNLMRQNANGNITRSNGGSGGAGPRMGGNNSGGGNGGFNRNENRSGGGSSNGPMRGNGNTQTTTSYSRR